MLRQHQHVVQYNDGTAFIPAKPMPKFIVTGSSIEFEIPDDWWQFCDMDNVRPATTFYLYSQRDPGVQAVPIAEVRPPERNAGSSDSTRIGWHRSCLLSRPIDVPYRRSRYGSSPIVIAIDMR